MAIKNGDFIELDYTGSFDGTIFDTTKEAVAKEAGLDPKAQYKPLIICVGEGQLLKGIDTFLEGKEPGSYHVTLQPEEAFGKKDGKLLKLIPKKKFTENKMTPVVGLEVNVDNHYGVIRSVSGGRVTVDFNHPLAGREVEYDLEVHGIVTDPARQVAALLDLAGVHHHGVTLEGKEHAVVTMHEVPPQPLAEMLNSMITKMTKVTTVSYQVEKEVEKGAQSDKNHH